MTNEEKIESLECEIKELKEINMFNEKIFSLGDINLFNKTWEEMDWEQRFSSLRLEHKEMYHDYSSLRSKNKILKELVLHLFKFSETNESIKKILSDI